MTPSPRIFFCLLAFGFLSGLVPLEANSPSELSKLEEQLEMLLGRRDSERETARQAALRKVIDAGKNGGAASAAYADAHRATEFAGKVGQSGEFSDWQKKNAGWLSDPDFRQAVQLHLEYLSLSLQRAGAEDGKEFAQPSREFMEKVANFQRRLVSKENVPSQVGEVLRSGVKGGLFAQAWSLQPFLEGLKDWADAPGNVEQILHQNIRPVLLETDGAAYLKTWDWQIDYEGALLQRERRQHARDQFEQVRQPALRFQQAAGQARLGQYQAAAQSGLDLLKNYPAHPEFSNWAKEVRQWIDQGKKAGEKTQESPKAGEEVKGVDENAEVTTPSSSDHG